MTYYFNTNPVASRVKCVAFIRKNDTGEVRQYPTELPVYEYDGVLDDHPSIFNWEENNYSCDCNRELFFERAAGNEIETEKCSDGRFSVRLQNPDTLEIYYDEFDK